LRRLVLRDLVRVLCGKVVEGLPGRRLRHGAVSTLHSPTSKLKCQWALRLSASQAGPVWRPQANETRHGALGLRDATSQAHGLERRFATGCICHRRYCAAALWRCGLGQHGRVQPRVPGPGGTPGPRETRRPQSAPSAPSAPSARRAPGTHRTDKEHGSVRTHQARLKAFPRGPNALGLRNRCPNFTKRTQLVSAIGSDIWLRSVRMVLALRTASQDEEPG
jgi:hypothetical protein